MASSIDKQKSETEVQIEKPEPAVTLEQTADHVNTVSKDTNFRCTLQLLYSDRFGIVIEAPHILNSDSIVIGRNPSEEGICLNDDRVSRIHATIRKINQYEIVDTKSRNGVLVNNIRITEKTLQDGDLIRLGNSFLLFRRFLTSSAIYRSEGAANHATARMLGRSSAITALRRRIEQLGSSEASVLLLGESGTGKDLTAEALHALSTRATGPFVPVNCAEIPDSIADNLLYGHEKGAYTGADRSALGYFRAAHRGTLFLDEVAELSPAVQAKLLRAIEKRQVFPVGSTKPIDIDLRIIAATNRDMVKAINLGDFRGDLYFRLAELQLHLPPLRERKEDILPILLSVWEKNPPRISVELAEALLLHSWPYNVRELLKIGTELFIKGQGCNEIGLDLVSERLAMNELLCTHISQPAIHSNSPASPKSESQIPTREELIELLRKHDNNISAIARERSRSRAQVLRWLKIYNIKKGNFDR